VIQVGPINVYTQAQPRKLRLVSGQKTHQGGTIMNLTRLAYSLNAPATHPPQTHLI
jgi:hypothetical protein